MPTVQPDPPTNSESGERGDCEVSVIPRKTLTPEHRIKLKLSRLTTRAQLRSWPVSPGMRSDVLADAMDTIANKDNSVKDRTLAANVVLTADKVSLAANQQQIDIAKIQIGAPEVVVNVGVKIDRMDAAKAYGPVLAKVIGLQEQEET